MNPLRKALWFSGGKDSTACLFLFERDLPYIEVIWANTGKYLPEHLEWIERLRKLCPNWHEVTSDRDEQNERVGLPADLIPVRSTAIGAGLSGPPEYKVQSWMQCCHENIMAPVWRKTHELGCQIVICGQRLEEPLKSTRRDGDVVDGVKFIHPIEHWTKEQTLAYVAARTTLPEFYKLQHSSIDCFDCTAYVTHTEDRAAYLKEHHPERHAQFIVRMKRLERAIDIDLKPMQRILANG